MERSALLVRFRLEHYVQEATKEVSFAREKVAPLQHCVHLGSLVVVNCFAALTQQTRKRDLVDSSVKEFLSPGAPDL